MLSGMVDPVGGQLPQSDVEMMKSSLFKTSFCGASSLLCGLVIVLAFACVYVVYLNFEFIGRHLDYGSMMLLSLFGFFGFVLLIFVISLTGLILAVLSFILREKRPVLAVLGLVLNASAFCMMVAIRFLSSD
jgi:hypothetical protein